MLRVISLNIYITICFNNHSSLMLFRIEYSILKCHHVRKRTRKCEYIYIYLENIMIGKRLSVLSIYSLHIFIYYEYTFIYIQMYRKDVPAALVFFFVLPY